MVAGTHSAVKQACLITSCEHGGNAVPAPWKGLFAGHEALVASHRGWDLGALPLARQLARAFAAPLFVATTTRLLVDLNRSIGHRRLFSELTRGLTRARRRAIVTSHYRPHRADVAWLYDPQRAGDVALAKRWQACLAQRAPALQLRGNYPYQGRDDGLASLLRKCHGAGAYVGIELEVNQRFVLQGGAAWTVLRADLVAALAAALVNTGSHFPISAGVNFPTLERFRCSAGG
jgi:predicted N-formylglutamate amidohydrolase